MSAPADGMTADARAAVDELLALRGQPIVLIPGGAAVEKPGGGRDYVPGPPRPPQILALFTNEALDGADQAQSDRGDTRVFEMKLIGGPDAVIHVRDRWEDFAATYVVDNVDATRSYQITALVTATLKVAGSTVIPYGT